MFVRNHHGGEKWLSGHIELVTGPVSFQVKLADGRTIRSHQDHIRKRVIEQETQEDTTESEEYEWSQESPVVISEESRDDQVASRPTDQSYVPASPFPMSNSQPNAEAGNQQRKYPARNHQPPDRYSDSSV